MNAHIHKLIERRFWIGFVVVVLSGSYVGMTYHYQGVFVNNWDLYPLLIAPSLVAGIFSGWKAILNCLLLHYIVAAMFFMRAIWGRHLTTDYTLFAFQLTADAVFSVLPRALLWCFLGSLPLSLTIWIIKTRERNA